MKVIRSSAVKKVRDPIGNYKFFLDKDTVFTISFVELMAMVQDSSDFILEKIRVPKEIVEKAKSQIASMAIPSQTLSKSQIGILTSFIEMNMTNRKSEKFKLKEFEKVLSREIDWEENIEEINRELNGKGMSMKIGKTVAEIVKK